MFWSSSRFGIIHFHFRCEEEQETHNTLCYNLRSFRIFDVGVKLSLTKALSHQIEVVGFLLPSDATWVDYWPHKGMGTGCISLYPRWFLPHQSSSSYSITARIKWTCDCKEEERTIVWMSSSENLERWYSHHECRHKKDCQSKKRIVWWGEKTKKVDMTSELSSCSWEWIILLISW